MDEAGHVRELLIEALAVDHNQDRFAFAMREPKPLAVDQAGRPGWRFTIDALLGERRFGSVRLDVVARRDEITGTERLPLPGTMAFARGCRIARRGCSPMARF